MRSPSVSSDLSSREVYMLLWFGGMANLFTPFEVGRSMK